MYVFLLVLGGLIAAAGAALMASGVSIKAHTLDSTFVTPATIAVIGGCILIGLGFVVRALQRVERALVARSVSRPVRTVEAAAGAGSERPNESVRIPFPPKPKSEPQSQPAPAAAAAAAPPEDAALERLREKFPTLVRLESAPVAEEKNISLLLPGAARSERDVAEVNSGLVAARANGAAAPGRPVSRIEASVRPSRPRQRAKNSIFDSLWPKAQRPMPEAAAASAAQGAPATPPADQPSPSGESLGAAPAAQAAAAAHETTVSVSILKSGVVDGMAYTLYSDGSIEAQLPQGTLRFGSITELRNHIEQSS
jgi:hypothetical protein